MLNNKGFSLIETVITMGLTALAATAILNMQSQGLKSNKDIETGALANDFANEIRVMLANGKTCLANLTIPNNVKSEAGDLKFDSSDVNASLDVDRITYGDGGLTVKAAVGKSLGHGNSAKITKISIDSLQAMTADQDSFRASLHLAFKKGEQSIGGKDKLIKIPIFLRTEVDSGSILKITGCATSAAEASNPILHCGSMGKIYLPTGFNGSAADVDGCVPATAFVGEQGPPGPAGSGSTGAAGPSSPGSGSVKSGDIIGGGTCTPYVSGPCEGQCGGSSTLCASTWTYSGVGQPGGCSTGIMQKTSEVVAGVTGYVCLQP